MKTKPYLVVYDIEGEISLARVLFTDAQVKAAKRLTSVYHVEPLPLEDLDDADADEILELRNEFDEESDLDDDFDTDDDDRGGFA